MGFGSGSGESRGKCGGGCKVTFGTSGSMTRWLIDFPSVRLLDRSWVTRFFGVEAPLASMVVWCWRPTGYTSACLSFAAQSVVIGIP